MESDVGRFRRRHLVPVPKVGSFTELTELIAAADELDNTRVIEGRGEDVGTAFAAEALTLGPLPGERFESRLMLQPLVDRHSRITVRCCRYSVPASLVGRRVRVLLGAWALEVFDGRAQVAVHQRSNRKGSVSLVLDHYLEVPRRKPGALPGASALAQARQAGTFTAEHEAFWSAARAALGDAEGTRELVDVLLLHRRHRHDEVVAGIAAALSAGAVRADVVAVETRQRADRHDVDRLRTAAEDQPVGCGLEGAGWGGRMVSLTRRRLADPVAVIAGLPADRRSLPQVGAYDQLLGRRPREVS